MVSLFQVSYFWETFIFMKSYEIQFINFFLIYILDGSAGDGTTRGKCPSSPSGLLCHSDGNCNVCRSIDSVHVGCQLFSSTPVCDADSTVIGIQDKNPDIDRRAVCSGCKKQGTFWEVLQLTLRCNSRGPNLYFLYTYIFRWNNQRRWIFTWKMPKIQLSVKRLLQHLRKYIRKFRRVWYII